MIFDDNPLDCVARLSEFLEDFFLNVCKFQMPVYAMGVTEHETPFSFGSSVPPLTFSWSVNSREVLHLESVYHGVSHV